MLVHFGLDGLRAEWPDAVACMGTFDGVHAGHRRVLALAMSKAREREVPCVVVTFDRHPMSVLAPERCPQAIRSLAQNLELIRETGISATVVLRFDDRLSKMPASEFLETVLADGVRAKSLVVGHDFAMGHGREGTSDWLAERIQTEVAPPFEIDGERVSSSKIRAAIESGRIEEANRLLERPFAIGGLVVSGQKLGRTLGFPTINLARALDQVMPADGVYAAEAVGDFGRFKAALAIGTRPAVGGGPRTIEAYLLDYDGPTLYGQSVEVEVSSRLREERTFASLEDLKVQMRRDVAEVRRQSTEAAENASIRAW